MHMRSASVQCTTVCTAALPSCTGMVSYILSSGTCTVGPDELKAKLSRVAGNAPLPLSGNLGAVDLPSQPLARFLMWCGVEMEGGGGIDAERGAGAGALTKYEGGH